MKAPSPFDIMERMTGELYSRFSLENAPRYDQWARSAGSDLTWSQFELHCALVWAEYFEKVIPSLVEMIRGLTFHRYQEPGSDNAVVEARFREVWVDSCDRLPRSRQYYARVEISLMLLVGMRPELDPQAEIEAMLVRSLVDSFEEYQREGKHPIAPARPAHDPLQVVAL